MFDKFSFLQELHKNTIRHNECIVRPNDDQRKYGSIHFLGKTRKLHRVVYWLGSEIDDIDSLRPSVVVRHKCRNRQCLNTNHYDIGTYKSNALDRKRDGTQRKGENHTSAKISLAIAQQIADSWRLNGDSEFKSLTERAKTFNVTTGLISAIDERRTWEDIKHPNKLPFNPRKNYTMAREKAKKRILKPEEYEQVKEKLFVSSKRIQLRNTFTECWVWVKNYNSFYPTLSIFGFTQQAHVYACEAKIGKRITGQVARHLCGVANCVNPEHMEFGTHKQNADDKKKHGTNRRLMTDDDVDRIRLVV